MWFQWEQLLSDTYFPNYFFCTRSLLEPISFCHYNGTTQFHTKMKIERFLCKFVKSGHFTVKDSQKKIFWTNFIINLNCSSFSFQSLYSMKRVNVTRAICRFRVCENDQKAISKSKMHLRLVTITILHETRIFWHTFLCKESIKFAN